MENFIKNNWFRVAIVIVLLVLCVIVYQMFNLSSQKNLSQEQEKCRQMGIKIDQQQADVTIPTRSPLVSSIGYYYNPELKTCLEAYDYQLNKYTSSAIKDDTSYVGYGIKDLYNNVDIFTCIDGWNTGKGIYDQMVMTENKNGIGASDDIVTKSNEKVWSLCAKPFKDLTGGRFWLLPDNS